MLGAISVDTPQSYIVLAGFFGGFGAPLVFVPLSVAAFATMRVDQRAEAGVLLTLSRTIGSSIGISIAVTQLTRWTQVQNSFLAENFTAYAPSRWHELGFEPGANPQTWGWTEEIARQAAGIAYAHDFQLLALATLAVLPLVWLVRSR
jgi:DHA2 family multidrug resistance protein